MKKYLPQVAIGSAVLTILAFQNCSKTKFDQAAEPQNITVNSELPSLMKSDSCETSDFTAFLNKRVPNGKGYSVFFAGGNDKDNTSHNFNYMAVPAPDTQISDPVYRQSIYN